MSQEEVSKLSSLESLFVSAVKMAVTLDKSRCFPLPDLLVLLLSSKSNFPVV